MPQRTPLDGLRTAGSPLVAPNKKSLHRQLGGGGRCRAGFKRRSAERVAGPVDPKVDGQLVVMRNAQPHDTMARARVQGPSTKTSHKEQGDSAERAQPGAEQRGRRRPALQQPPRGRGAPNQHWAPSPLPGLPLRARLGPCPAGKEGRLGAQSRPRAQWKGTARLTDDRSSLALHSSLALQMSPATRCG